MGLQGGGSGEILPPGAANDKVPVGLRGFDSERRGMELHRIESKHLFCPQFHMFVPG